MTNSIKPTDSYEPQPQVSPLQYYAECISYTHIYSTAELAEETGFSQRKLQRLIKENKLRVIAHLPNPQGGYKILGQAFLDYVAKEMQERVQGLIKLE